MKLIVSNCDETNASDKLGLEVSLPACNGRVLPFMIVKAGKA